MALSPTSSRGMVQPSQWVLDAVGDLVVNTDSDDAAFMTWQALDTGEKVTVDATLGVTVTGNSSRVQVRDTGLVRRFHATRQLLLIGIVADPGAALLGNSELALWLDDTPAATALKVRAKDSAGTSRTATIPLA